MTQAIILDLDGTLFNSRRAISDANLAAVRACCAAGILVVIATARPRRTVVEMIPQELADGYLVLCNGAWVVKAGTVVARNELPPATVARCVLAVQRLGYTPAIEADDCFYTDRPPHPNFMGAYEPLAAWSQGPACKVIAYHADGIDAQLVAQEMGPDVSLVILDRGTLLNVATPSCSKLSACQAILAAEGIALANVAAFGDDTNDIAVLAAVGCGIAMGNAAPELRAVARYVTASNDDDGVALGILRHVLQP